MKLAQLSIVKQPAPVTKKACMACKAFAAECLVPVGDGAMPMCWLCAHHVIDHESPIHEACEARCECHPHQIYPGREVQVDVSLTAEEVPEAPAAPEKRLSKVEEALRTLEALTPAERKQVRDSFRTARRN